MDLANLQTSGWLVYWPWWVLIGLAVGYFLLLVWSWFVAAKQADESLEANARERLSDQVEMNGNGRP